MSETASFVDPVFLARFGLSRVNVVDYFLHPLNPFRTSSNTSNEVLAMQGIGVGMFIQSGPNGLPMPPQAAEEEYAKALSRLTGEQYELLPPTDPSMYLQPSPLYTIRHVLRTNPSSVKILGVYYVVEGVIYKSPAIRSLMKSNVARTLDGLAGACSALSVCARYLPSTGYTWHFDENHDNVDPVALMKLNKRMKRRKILDNRKAGERSEAEEEGLRASQAIDQILVRLSKSQLVTSVAPTRDTIAVAEPPPSASSSTTGVLSSR
jgi:MED6 mediator sub complex component